MGESSACTGSVTTRLMPLIDVANVACGFQHAWHFNHMRETVRLAKQQWRRVGAHSVAARLQGFAPRMAMKAGENGELLLSDRRA